ncbi:MAG TPA: hypothetical protein VLT45_26250 [Kofleriaceae bacterium]|nr:hypothetical protein [Kofleriaceae bacterium]
MKLLAAKKETKSRGEALAAQLDKQRKRLQRLSVQDVWRGSNDPIRFQAAEYGKQRHRDMWHDKRCDVPTGEDNQVKFPGSKPNKPDCIVAASCEIWEFKPDSTEGHRKGAEQISSYKNLVPAYYTEMYRKKETPPAELGGERVMAALIAHCLHDGEIRFSGDVKYYNMCEKHYECVGD